jgi:poly-beta-1,6-N-acetyl-D-glucosamine synthase
MGDPVFLVIFIIYAIAALIQLIYYIYFYLSVNNYKHSAGDSHNPAVSVIICARNEAANLEKFLPSVLEQDYPRFEVIVVNDCSEDNSYDILGKYLLQYPNLKVSTIYKDPKFTHFKKFAQFIGIKAAKNEILLFTDADCQPTSRRWIQIMVSNFNEETDFVLGYGKYKQTRGFFNAYIRYDTSFIAMQYLGMAIRGIPYMGVGRNLAYRRSVFFERKGFKSHTHLASGDDDLFVNHNASHLNTMVEFRHDGHTESIPCSTINEFISQKKRHFTTAPYYKPEHKFILGTEPFTRMVFYILFVTLVSFKFMWIPVTAVFGTRLIVQTAILRLVQQKLNEKGLLLYSLFFDIFSPVINGVLYFLAKRKSTGKTEWR